MSIESMINIKTVQTEKDINILLEKFHISKWNYLHENQVTFLPINDDDMYDWKIETLDRRDINSIINAKQLNNEKIGIVLYFDDTEIGITLLADNTAEILLSLDINRVSIKNKETDMTWYVENLIIPLKKHGLIITSVSFDDTDL